MTADGISMRGFYACFKRVCAACILLMSFLNNQAVADALRGGSYVGVNLGRSWSSFTFIDNANPLVSSEASWWPWSFWWGDVNYGSDTGKITGGMEIGYNFRQNNILFGAEADLGVGMISGQAHDTVNIGPIITVKDKFYGSLAGRLGYVFNNTLIYTKAGWGGVSVKYNFVDKPDGPYASQEMSDLLNGPVYGFGLEYALSPNISVKTEYMRFDVADVVAFSHARFNTRFGLTGSNQYVNPIEMDAIDTLKFGLNVHLK
jgi:opacity protein-like surface antigen